MSEENVAGNAVDAGSVEVEKEVSPTVASRLKHPVLVSDRIPERQRRLEDAAEMALAVAGIALVLLMGVYAASTTQGVEEDVRAAFDSVIRRVLFLPLSVLEALFVIIAPVALIVDLLRRAEFTTIIQTVVTGVATSLIGWGILLAFPHLPEVITSRMEVSTPTGQIISINVVFMVISAMTTVVGTMGTSKSVKFTWISIWILLFFALIRGTATLPGILITVLLGRLFGCAARWLGGFNDLRAMPVDLVEAALSVGLDPVRIVRVDLPTTDQPLETWVVTEGEQEPDYRLGQIHPPLVTNAWHQEESQVVVTAQHAQDCDRQYQMWVAGGDILEVHVLDPEDSITSLAADVWQNIRLRGTERLVSSAIKINAQREMLAAVTVADSGVRTPRPVGLADAGSSVVVFWEPLPPTISLLGLRDEGVEISDDTLDQAWQQLNDAHRRDVCHRNLDEDSLTLDSAFNVWMLNWNHADMGAKDLVHRIDCAQMLVYLSLATDVDRAIASAERQIGTAELLTVSLVLQSAVLPPKLRSRARKAGVLDKLRDRLATIAPQVDTPEPIKLQRFSPRTVVMTLILVIALVAVMGSLNFAAVASAIRDANVVWIVVAFLLGAVTWVGAAIPLVAFAPTKIRLWNATLAQMAASIVTLVAPAGIGPAALNLRFLNREKLSTPVAVATVTLVQISQFLTSVALLLLVVVGTGATLDFDLPTTAIIWVAATVSTLLAAALSIKKLRTWAWEKLRPSWDQVYPQLLWILGHPRQLLIAVGGNMLMNIGYIGAFGSALAAFGYSMNPLSLALTYLASSTVGSIIPTPGGIGPVEAALTAGLQVAGIPPAIALSTAVLFRLVTFYGRIPFGWVALKRMEKKGLL